MESEAFDAQPVQLTERRIRFEFADDFEPMWSPALPETAIASNAISLLMPHVEPWVASAVRDGSEEQHETLRDQARSFAFQESQHHAQHRRLNDQLMERYRGLRGLDRLMNATFSVLRRRSSPAFAQAFATGFETMAFGGARWVDSHLGWLFGEADPVPSSLMLWHLAEEVEHKTVAWDVYKGNGGGRLRYLVGALTSLFLLTTFAAAASVVMLWGERRILNPIAWGRLIGWSVTVMFEMLSILAASLQGGHHPSQLTDPAWFGAWLGTYDPVTETLPLWNAL
jgi:uncharacterized protein